MPSALVFRRIRILQQSKYGRINVETNHISISYKFDSFSLFRFGNFYAVNDSWAQKSPGIRSTSMHLGTEFS